MSNFFIPILESNEEGRESKLFSISSKLGDLTRINGFNPRDLIKKIDTYFSPKKIDFSLLDFKKEPFERFSNNTESISLGVFCSAFATINKRIIKSKYDSITITGNIEIIENSVKLCNVVCIQEKFFAVKKYANEHKDKQHLFIYVSAEEEIQEGWQDNIFVLHCLQGTPIEFIYSEIFEMNEVQINSWKNISYKQRNEYIETQCYINWKKELFCTDCNGFIIRGKSNTGKSIATIKLCESLLTANIIDEVIWLTITDNAFFWNIIKPKGLGNDTYSGFKKEYEKQFEILEKNLEAGKKSLFVIDNIEADFVDDLVDFFYKNYKAWILSKDLKILFTAWDQCKYTEKIQKLKIVEKSAEELKIEKAEFNLIINSVIRNFKYKDAYYSASSEEKNHLINLLFEQCRDEDNNYLPGYVFPAISPLKDLSITELIERYKEVDIKDLYRKVRILKISFETLDLFSQMVLFAFLGIKDFKNTLNEDQLGNLINGKLFNKKFKNNPVLTKRNIIIAIKELVQKGLLVDSANETYSLKRETLNYCVFSKKETQEISSELSLARDSLIPINKKIEYAIDNDLLDEYERLVDSMTDTSKNNELFMYCIIHNRGISYLEKLIKKGIDSKFTDEDGQTAMDVLWCTNQSLEVINYLRKNGFEIHKEIPAKQENGEKIFISPLELCLDKDEFPLIDYALDNHLYRDIDDDSNFGITPFQFYCFKGKYIEILEKFIKLGANVKLFPKKENLELSTSLHLSLYNNEHPEFAECLLKNNLYEKIDQKDMSGSTPLHLALSNCNSLEVIELLLKNGADWKVSDNQGNSSLHLAAMNSNSEILKYLVLNHYYDDIDIENKVFGTPLQWAIGRGKTIECFKILVKNSADWKRISLKGQTILHLAVMNYEHLEIFEYLLENNYVEDINKKNQFDQTVFELADSYLVKLENKPENADRIKKLKKIKYLIEKYEIK